MAGVCGLIAVAVALVILSLRQPDVIEYVPTPIGGAEPVGPGPHLLTVDSSDPERWRYLSLARGSVVENPGPLDWDLAFRRFQVLVNGGAGFPGAGGALDLGAVPLDSVTRLPGAGYVGMEAVGRDTSHAVLDRWYSYSLTTHVLKPKDRTLALRTAVGRPVALRFVSYYCPSAQPGCVTLRYTFLEPAAAVP